MQLDILMAEIFGTMILILLGDGVVAGVLLAKSKANASGWIVITMAWAFAVFAGVVVAGPFSGAHLNPAVTIGLYTKDIIAGTTIDVALFGTYIVGEMIGAMLGAFLVFLHYYPHWAETEDPGLKLAVFSTGPAIRNTAWNFVSEVIGTFVLVFVIFAFGNNAGDRRRPGRPRRAARRLPGPRDRPGPRRHDRIRDQPRPRPWAADHARDPADPRQGQLRLGLLVDPGRRPARRRRRRGDRLPGDLRRDGREAAAA